MTRPASPIPIIVSTWSFAQRGHRDAWPILASGGNALDAVERACITVEDDPEIDSVGTGGLPDADGSVTLDGCIMRSPRESGSVCAVRDYPNPVSIARRVMEQTPHQMLAGNGATQFAAAQGFTTRDLLTAETRAKYAAWKAAPTVEDQSKDRALLESLRPVDAGESGRLFRQSSADAPTDNDDESRWSHHDTIGTLAIDEAGTLAGACSTSGTPYKLPGRVGDSPIIGHGLYVDPEVGAATATGTGELVMAICGSFLAVEEMRRGQTGADAIREVLERILNWFELKPQDQVALITLSPSGAWAAGALRPGFRVAIHTSERDEVVAPMFTLLDD